MILSIGDLYKIKIPRKVWLYPYRIGQENVYVGFIKPETEFLLVENNSFYRYEINVKVLTTAGLVGWLSYSGTPEEILQKVM